MKRIGIGIPLYFFLKATFTPSLSSALGQTLDPQSLWLLFELWPLASLSTSGSAPALPIQNPYNYIPCCDWKGYNTLLSDHLTIIVSLLLTFPLFLSANRKCKSIYSCYTFLHVYIIRLLNIIGPCWTLSFSYGTTTQVIVAVYLVSGSITIFDQFRSVWVSWLLKG